MNEEQLLTKEETTDEEQLLPTEETANAEQVLPTEEELANEEQVLPTEETANAEQVLLADEETVTEEPVREVSLNGKKKAFTTKRITLMAVFTALAYVVSLIDFPIFPATPFLKLDFGNTFILLIAFLLGPIEGVIVCVLKEIIRIPSGSTGGVGELANMLVTSAYILLPSILYRYKKGLKYVIPSLGGGCVLGTCVALLTNRYINFPLYMGAGAAAVFQETFGFILAFNLIKTVVISVLTLLLYKKLSTFIKGLNL